MGTISNRFFVQVIEDGATLHGEIRATKSLTQAFKNPGCIPDWTVADNQPTIYVTLQNGTTFILPDSTYKWYYNGNEITWNGNTSNAVADLAAGTFQKVTNYTPSGYSAGQYVPAIKIVKNLANSSNVDIDVIRFDGQKTLSSNPVAFSASLNVTITEWTEGGYLGIINFLNGIADIDSQNTSVTCQGLLYDGDGTALSSGVTYKWYFEGDSTVKGTAQSFTVTAADVIDYVMVRCEFYMTVEGVSTLVYTAYAGIDDTQDPEYMWIQYNGANGNSASLRENESVTFSIWVGKADDPTYKDVSFTSFKVKLFDSTGTVVTATSSTSYTVANDSTIKKTPDGTTGYRTLDVSSAVATAKLYYNDVFFLCKKGLSGVIIASTAS